MLPGFTFLWKFSLNLSKFCQARFNIWLFRLLPFRVSRWYLFLLGKLYYFLKKKEKALIQTTIRHVVGGELEPASLKGLIKETFRGIIDHYHEKLFVAYSNFPRLLKFLRNRIKLNGEAESKRFWPRAGASSWSPGTTARWSFCPGPWRCAGIRSP